MGKLPAPLKRSEGPTSHPPATSGIHIFMGGQGWDRQNPSYGKRAPEEKGVLFPGTRGEQPQTHSERLGSGRS